MAEDQNPSFFTVLFDAILCWKPLPYDLYVNSSKVEGKEKFVRIFPSGESLSKDEVIEFKKKYHQLYVPEAQRAAYLQSMVHSDALNDETKTTVIKDSAIQYLGTIFDEEKEFNTEVLTEAISGCRDSVASMVDVIQDYKIEQLQDLIANLSFHDFYTYDHSINVSMYNILILRSFYPKATKEQLTEVGLSGMLHDLGKLKIPTHIINKPDKLSEEEFAQIKKHPDYGLELLKECENAVEGVNFEVISRVVNEHHENYNGSGYPRNLVGEKIHIYARITAISDFFDAMTTKRSYHEVMTTQEAINIMGKSRGKKLDPKLFDFFARHINTFVRSGESPLQLPDDFDPCQPQNELPLEEAKEEKKKQDFGSIKILEEKENTLSGIKRKKAS